jgi:hypothetical protein
MMDQSIVQPVVLRAVEHIRRHLGRDLSALYLRGSATRDDWIPGLSDVDFYVVVKDDLPRTRGSIKSELDQVMRLGFPEPQISCRVVTESEMRQNRIGSYLTGLDAKLLLGNALLEGQQTPTLGELRTFGQRYSEYLSRYWIGIRDQRNTFEEEVRRLDYLVLKSAQSILMAHGVVALRKDEVTELFLKEFGDLPLAYVVDKARDVRSSWPKPMERPQELSLFCREATSFLSGSENYLKARRSTQIVR